MGHSKTTGRPPLFSGRRSPICGPSGQPPKICRRTRVLSCLLHRSIPFQGDSVCENSFDRVCVRKSMKDCVMIHITVPDFSYNQYFCTFFIVHEVVCRACEPNQWRRDSPSRLRSRPEHFRGLTTSQRRHPLALGARVGRKTDDLGHRLTATEGLHQWPYISNAQACQCSKERAPSCDNNDMQY